jgi:hypothetical protein
MGNITEEFKKLMRKEIPDKSMLVPLMIWCSGKRDNIEKIQKINKKFSYVNRKIFIYELTFNNSINHFIKYPKVQKDDEKTKFFYDDLQLFLGWTGREFHYNLNVLDIEQWKEIIAYNFGYDKKQRKVIGIK